MAIAEGRVEPHVTEARVDFCGAYKSVSHQALNDSYVRSVFQQVGREAVAKHSWSYPIQAYAFSQPTDHAIDRRFRDRTPLSF